MARLLIEIIGCLAAVGGALGLVIGGEMAGHSKRLDGGGFIFIGLLLLFVALSISFHLGRVSA